MNFQKLKIEPKKAGGRGRTFAVALLNYITADTLWALGTGGEKDVHRPVYLTYAGTEQEVTAFTANLRTGRKAKIYSEYDHDTRYAIEVPRSAGLKFVQQRLSDGNAAMTVYLPEVWRLEPEVLPEKVSFLFAPPTWWLDAQEPRLEQLPPAERRTAAIASYFAAFLDRRSPLPIINEVAFHQRIWRAAAEHDWLIEPHGYHGNRGKLFIYPEKSPLAGLELVRLINVDHQAFEQFLGQQVELYRKEENRGATRIPRVGRLLPHAPNVAFQHQLFGEVAATQGEVAALRPIRSLCGGGGGDPGAPEAVVARRVSRQRSRGGQGGGDGGGEGGPVVQQRLAF